LVLTPADAGTIAERNRSHLANHTQTDDPPDFLVSVFARADEVFATIDVLPVPTGRRTWYQLEEAVHSKAIGLSPGETSPKPAPKQALVRMAAMQLEETSVCAPG